MNDLSHPARGPVSVVCEKPVRPAMKPTVEPPPVAAEALSPPAPPKQDRLAGQRAAEPGARTEHAGVTLAASLGSPEARTAAQRRTLKYVCAVGMVLLAATAVGLTIQLASDSPDSQSASIAGDAIRTVTNTRPAVPTRRGERREASSREATDNARSPVGNSSVVELSSIDVGDADTSDTRSSTRRSELSHVLTVPVAYRRDGRKAYATPVVAAATAAIVRGLVEDVDWEVQAGSRADANVAGEIAPRALASAGDAKDVSASQPLVGEPNVVGNELGPDLPTPESVVRASERRRETVAARTTPAANEGRGSPAAAVGEPASVPAASDAKVKTIQVAGVCAAAGDELPQFGTEIRWARSSDQALELARQQDKLLFVMHVSGNFAEPGFT